MNIAIIIVVHLVWQAANIVHAYFDPSPIVPMSEYGEDHRVLDCHQCFEAKGKFCHHKEYGMTLHDTKEANQGYAFCCKQDSISGFCSPNSSYECSMPSFVSNPDESPYHSVLTSTNRNYQMFAFCPLLSQRTCGISKDDKPDVTIRATQEEQIIYSKEMRYMRPSPNHTKEYDFCHYNIKVNDSFPEDEL